METAQEATDRFKKDCQVVKAQQKEVKDLIWEQNAEPTRERDARISAMEIKIQDEVDALDHRLSIFLLNTMLDKAGDNKGIGGIEIMKHD